MTDAQAAVGALSILSDPARNPRLQRDGTLELMWPAAGIARATQHPRVARVVPLGTVLALELEVPEGEAGYASGAAREVTVRLRRRGVYARPLGNVVYIMCTPTTSAGITERLLDALLASLDGERECVRPAACPL